MKQTNKTAPGQIIANGKLVYTSIDIKATPATIWNILMDFNAYPSWNPFIRSISGNGNKGSRLSATLCPPNGKEMQFAPTVLQNKTAREFRWLGNLIVPYLFDGEHTFLLQENEDGTTTFHHYERFRGVLVPFLKKMLDTDTRQGFKLMNAKLKEMAESAAAA